MRTCQERSWRKVPDPTYGATDWYSKSRATVQRRQRQTIRVDCPALQCDPREVVFGELMTGADAAAAASLGQFRPAPITAVDLVRRDYRYLDEGCTIAEPFG